MFRNILVCVDCSPQADEALAQAIDLADCQRSRLTILTAIVRPPSWLGNPMTAASIEPLAADLRAEAEATLRRAVDAVPDCIPVTTILSEDSIRDALVGELHRGAHDLLVVGTRGRGALGASLHGSVSAYALRHCEIPVLMVRGEQAPEAAPAPQLPRDDAVGEPLPAAKPTTA